MHVSLFCHSLVSDWNHGNAHFLRGVIAELKGRGHQVRVYEPRDGWSVTHLQHHHAGAIEDFHRRFPHLTSELYDIDGNSIDAALDGADVVVVHEWTEPRVLERIAQHRTRQGKYALLFHDTHHRAVSDPDALAKLALERFDGVLAFGASLAEQYRRLGWGRRVWVWHEAADTRVFYPRSNPCDAIDDRQPVVGDLVWIGNWGDDERVHELETYLLGPVRRLTLRTRVHGVRYPAEALAILSNAGIEYAGYVPNYRVPEVFAQFRVTVHVPRGPYALSLPGIPTIRPFEALACGIPLVSAPWSDCEGLFRPGDFVMANSTDEMTAALRRLLDDPELARGVAASGLETIRARHTCAHRVDELFAILAELGRHEHARAPQEV
jgi:spore maturation protein CgeB